MCSTTGNRSFPILLGFSPTREQFARVRDTYAIDFKWAKRTAPPIFTNVTQMTLSESGNATSKCTYNGIKYSLFQAQICQPTHTGWLESLILQQKNVADVLMIFKADSPTADLKYIFVVIPLLQETTFTGDSTFLQGLAGQNVTGPFQLGQVLPQTDKTFAAYQTCFNPAGINALSVVFLAGRQVSRVILETMRMSAGGNVPSFLGPNDINIEQANTLTSSQFQTNVRVSELGATASTGTEGVNPTAAYQCVVLDPERDVLDGKITVDTTTGDVKHMNDILKEREAVKRSYTARKGIAPGVLEKYLAIFLGIILSILILWGVGWAALTATGREYLWTTLPDFVRAVPLNLIIALFFMFLGVLIGLFGK